jgi:hypothetical protein
MMCPIASASASTGITSVVRGHESSMTGVEVSTHVVGIPPSPEEDPSEDPPSDDPPDDEPVPSVVLESVGPGFELLEHAQMLPTATSPTTKATCLFMALSVLK